MRKQVLRVIAVAALLAVLLGGCMLTDLSDYPEDLLAAMGKIDVDTDDLEYERPDMEQFQQVLRECCALAEESGDVEKVIDAVYDFYDVYDSFSTNYALANLRYCHDLTDVYWQEEYGYCSENTAAVDAGLDELYYALAKSPCLEELESEEYFGEGFFDQYQGESLYDETFISLLEQEASLTNRYYALSEEAGETEYYSGEYFSRFHEPMTQLLIELVKVRHQIADYAGYDSYVEFAYDFYHYRDYTPAEAEDYLQSVGVKLGDVYRQVNESGLWSLGEGYCSERETFAYAKKAAENMGGSVWKAFQLLEESRLYDAAYSEKKMDGAFEVYLTSYNVPYIFMSPYLDRTDKLSFVHEFGHFCNDYVCSGSMAGLDVAEVHSQAMEYLSLCYTAGDTDLMGYKMVDSLGVYMEQSAYALFEQRLYSLPTQELTVENVHALYRQIGTDFGFTGWNWDDRDYISLSHIYTDPMYLVSYVVSNDLALQIYQAELAEEGSGLAMYQKSLESEESYLLTFAESIGLESPFGSGRLEAVAKTFQEKLDKIM